MSLLEHLRPLTHGIGEDATELAGLGILAAPSIDEAQAHARAALAHEYNKPGVKKRELLPHATKPITEVTGLGVLAVPSALKLMGKHAMDPHLLASLKNTAGAGAKLNLSALTRGPVLKSETGALQSAARRGVGGLDTLYRPPPQTFHSPTVGGWGGGFGPREVPAARLGASAPAGAPVRVFVEKDPFAKAATAGFFDELLKLGAITDEQAQKSIDRLETLEKQSPTTSQVARYGVLGAGAGALGHVMSRAIEGGINKPTPRSALGAAASGALAMGAVPLVRGALDRRAERRTLKDYLTQEHVGEYGKNHNTETGSVEPPTGLSRAGYNV